MADLRETLIRAAAAEVHRAACGCDGSLHSRDEYNCLYRGRAVAALSGALPLIAEAIDAEPYRYRIPNNPESYDSYWEGYDDGMDHAAAVVREIDAALAAVEQDEPKTMSYYGTGLLARIGKQNNRSRV